jgi:MoxR-like ATPase
MSNLSDPNSYLWDEIEDLAKFQTPEWSSRILEGLSVYKTNGSGVDQDRRNTVANLLHLHSQESIKRLKNLQKRLNDIFVGKEEIIEMVIVSAIAQQPMLLIGPPGTAKSKIITRFCEGLGIGRVGDENAKQTCFQYLLHGFTEPDEILGPVHIPSLQKDPPIFKRHREGSITESEVIFLDEVFKANSAILNALLTIINERKIYEGGKAYPAKARLIYGASNDPPAARQLEELRAFYERFIIRMESVYLRQGSAGDEVSRDRQQLLERGWKDEVKDLRAGYNPEKTAPEPAACLNDILLCNRAVTEFWGGEKLEDTNIQNFLPVFHQLTTRLVREEMPVCSIDDRKFIRLFLVIRAHALFTHNGSPDIQDLVVLKHIWEDQNSKEKLFHYVTDFIKTYGSKINS